MFDGYWFCFEITYGGDILMQRRTDDPVASIRSYEWIKD